MLVAGNMWTEDLEQQENDQKIFPVKSEIYHTMREAAEKKHLEETGRDDFEYPSWDDVVIPPEQMPIPITWSDAELRSRHFVQFQNAATWGTGVFAFCTALTYCAASWRVGPYLKRHIGTTQKTMLKELGYGFFPWRMGVRIPIDVAVIASVGLCGGSGCLVLGSWLLDPSASFSWPTGAASFLDDLGGIAGLWGFTALCAVCISAPVTFPIGVFVCHGAVKESLKLLEDMPAGDDGNADFDVELTGSDVESVTRIFPISDATRKD